MRLCNLVHKEISLINKNGYRTPHATILIPIKRTVLFPFAKVPGNYIKAEATVGTASVPAIAQMRTQSGSHSAPLQLLTHSDSYALGD